jgi:CBS domain-containing protein
MKVQDVMSRAVKLVAPGDSVENAARLMAQLDVGALPVGDDDRLVGMITDRDIAIRAVAKGKSPAQCTVREVMSEGIKYVFDDESADDAARNMADLQIRRLPVLNRDKRLVGIVSLGDLAVKTGGKPAALAIRKVSRSESMHTH